MPFSPQQQAVLQAQIAQVQSQIASGLERASYEGKSADFRSLQDLYRIRDDLLAQLGLTARVRRTVTSYSGGF